MFSDLAAELNGRTEIIPMLSGAKIDFSFMGICVNINNDRDPITEIDRYLSNLTEKGKRVLITVDEVLSARRTREFAAQFQIYLRKGYQVFLLMTGLYDNISNLQDGKH